MNAIKQNERIFVRLDRGEKIISSLRNLRKQYQISNGLLQGIGAVDKVKLGNYQVEDQQYEEKQFEGSFEVTSFSGNIGPDKIHTHITISNHNYVPKAGHCAMARVSGTFEIIILVTEGLPLNHRYDQATGLDIIDF